VGDRGTSGRYNADTSSDMLRLTVPDAARALGISPEAVRNRLSRGTLESVKESGTVYVLIDRDRLPHADDISHDRSGESASAGGLISEMRARIDSLERQLEQAHERQLSPELPSRGGLSFTRPPSSNWRTSPVPPSSGRQSSPMPSSQGGRSSPVPPSSSWRSSPVPPLRSRQVSTTPDSRKAQSSGL
jgi:hypothetical protein